MFNYSVPTLWIFFVIDPWSSLRLGNSQMLKESSSLNCGSANSVAKQGQLLPRVPAVILLPIV